MYNVTLSRIRATIVTVANNVYYTTWVCVFVALGTQHVMRMRPVVIRGLARSNNIFPHFLINVTVFEKKVTE
jgi:hypothetical protein